MVSFNSAARDNIKIRKAHRNDVQEIHKVLSRSFEPYRRDYTEEAYGATVISPREIENRIADHETDVLVAVHDGKIVGTVSIEMRKKGTLHIRSMAVKPDYQGKGIGWRILQEINEIAKKKHCQTITLECFEPLTKAVSLYEKFGFRRTGRKRDLYGIKIFEMARHVGLTRKNMLVDAFGNWLFTLLILPLTLIFLIQNFGLEFVTRDHVKLILEFVFIGMLPLIIVLTRKESCRDYGFTLTNWRKSVAYGLILAAPFMIIRLYAYLFMDYVGWSWNLNPLMFLPFLLVYGSLEAFFIVFSIHKIDKGLSSERLFSKRVDSKFNTLRINAHDKLHVVSQHNFHFNKLCFGKHYPSLICRSNLQEV